MLRYFSRYSMYIPAWAYFMTSHQIQQWQGMLIPDGWWESSISTKEERGRDV
jgi:gamma-glutamylcyclotransferase (GGCT)/AIG2-like uncharacterized protein YtfP